MNDTLAADVKRAAEELGSIHPGAHFLCVGIENGEVRLYAKSPIINDKLDAVAALEWVAQQTLRTTAVETAEKLSRKREP